MIKEIIQDFSEYSEHFNEWLTYKRLGIKIALAMKLADMMCYALNKQIRVVLNSKRHFECWSSDTISNRKRAGQIPKNWGAAELSKITFYLTPTTRNNTISVEERKAYRDKYIKYMKAFRNRM